MTMSVSPTNTPFCPSLMMIKVGVDLTASSVIREERAARAGPGSVRVNATSFPLRNSSGIPGFYLALRRLEKKGPV